MWLIGLHVSIAFLVKILNILLCKTVTEREKSWVRDVVMFCLLKHLFNFTHHQATGLLLVFSVSLNFWKPQVPP